VQGCAGTFPEIVNAIAQWTVQGPDNAIHNVGHVGIVAAAATVAVLLYDFAVADPVNEFPENIYSDDDDDMD
jgi:hypothetical protein